MTSPKSSKYTDAMAALAALAEDGDEDAKKAMKKMLVAKSDPDAPAKSSAPPAKSSAPPAKKSSAPPGAQAAAAPATGEVDLHKELITLRNEITAKNVAEERATLLASRPDLGKDAKTAAWLAKAPIETVREAVATLPVLAPAAAQAAAPTQGLGQGGPAGLPADQSEILKRRMGLTPHPVSATARVGFKTVFGATPDQVKEIEAGTIRFDKDSK